MKPKTAKRAKTTPPAPIPIAAATPLLRDVPAATRDTRTKLGPGLMAPKRSAPSIPKIMPDDSIAVPQRNRTNALHIPQLFEACMLMATQPEVFALSPAGPPTRLHLAYFCAAHQVQSTSERNAIKIPAYQTPAPNFATSTPHAHFYSRKMCEALLSKAKRLLGIPTRRNVLNSSLV